MLDNQENTNAPRRVLEFLLVFAVFFVSAASFPPDVNEAHYLSRARHHWDNDWCSGDVFLESSAAHGTFYSLFGWVTRWVSLPTAAWTGRVLTWSLLACAWQRLSRAFVSGPFLAVASAALFVTFQHWGHMAGEWVVGGLEAKGFAYAFVLFALEALVVGKWNRVWLLLGVASSLHVLVGGWAVVAALLAYGWSGRERPPLLGMVPALFGGLMLSLPGLLPALALNWQSEAEVTQLANRLYVFVRLPHHLVFHNFSPFLVARHVALLLVAVLVITQGAWDERQRRLLRFVSGAVCIAFVGILLGFASMLQPDWATSLLRFYWFRLSDAMVPIATALALVAFVREQKLHRPRLTAGLSLVATGAAVMSLSQIGWGTCRDPRPPAIVQSAPRGESQAFSEQRYREWRRICSWIVQNTEPDSVVLAPRYQQSLRWFAERAEVVNWKDVPQDAPGIVEWRRRMVDVYPRATAWQGLVGHGESRLQELASKYRFQYVLLDRSRSKRPLSFPRLFPPVSEDSIYELYRIP